MKKFCPLVLMPLVFAGCSNIRNTDAQSTIANDLLPLFMQTDEAALLQFYADEIAECEKLNAAYSVYSAEIDLNLDHLPETISYFISTLHSGSSGNVILNVHTEDRIIPFFEPIYLNPHPDGVNLTPKLQMIGSVTNGYCEVKYVTINTSGDVTEERYFQFDGTAFTAE